MLFYPYNTIFSHERQVGELAAGLYKQYGKYLFSGSNTVVSHKTSNRNSNDSDDETLSIQSDFTSKKYDVGSPDINSSKHAFSKGFCLLAHSSMNGCSLFANSALSILITHIVRQ